MIVAFLTKPILLMAPRAPRFLPQIFQLIPGQWPFKSVLSLLAFPLTGKPTPSTMATETGADEVAIDVPTYFRIFKSGRIERLHLPPILPACLDEDTGVASKDVVLDASTGLFVRVYLPKLQDSSRKLPVLVYFHGGGFVIESAVSATYHNYLNALAAAAGVIVVSVEYRRAPEHQLPAAYEDSWAALQWAASAQGEWIAEHGDVARLFIAGDSAGANIVHDMLLRASGNNGPSIEGAILFHPWFAGSEVIDGEQESGLEFSAKLWAYVCPGAVGGSDDPRINPLAPGAPALEKLGCARMLVCTAKEDKLFARGRAYYDALAASAWPGTVDWFESDGEEHVFFLQRPECESAKQLMDRVVAFIAGARVAMSASALAMGLNRSWRGGFSFTGLNK